MVVAFADDGGGKNERSLDTSSGRVRRGCFGWRRHVAPMAGSRQTMSYLMAHPYLVESLVLVVLAVAMLGCLPRLRGLLLAAGLMAVPCVLLSRYHIPHFWNPVCVAYCVACPEDVLWVFAAAVTACSLALAPFAGRLNVRLRRRLMWTRYAGVLAGCGLFFAGSLWALPRPDDIMYATVLAMGATGVGCAVLRRDLIPLGVVGSIAYTFYHGADVFAFTHIWPETAAYWKPAAQLPFSIGRVPGFELIWAMTFGFMWPLVMGYCGDLSWRQTPASPPLQAPRRDPWRTEGNPPNR